MSPVRAVAVGLILLLGGCAPAADPGILRMGLANAPVNLDPRFATDAASTRVNRLLYRRLVELDAADRPVPGLARWERPAPDRYRFTLLPDPEGRTFADGTPLEARDVAATLASIRDPATGSPYRTQLGLIERVEVLSPETIEIGLTRPDPLFPAFLAIEILPAAGIAGGRRFQREPLGSGPFALADWPEAGRLLLRRRADGARVELAEVRDPGVRVMKLLRGEIDLLQSDLSPELTGYLGRQPGIRLERTAGSNFSYLGFNLEDPHTGRPEVRRAVAHAIDRDAIVRYLLQGAARPAESLLSPDHWAGASGLAGHGYDPDLARRLLAQAGYGPDKPLTLEYKTSTDPLRLRIATVIQAQLAEVGIEVRVRSLDWGTFYGDVKAGRFQMFSLTWVGVHTPDHFRYVFHSASVPPVGANRGRYRSERADRLIERAEALDDLEAQAAAWGELQSLLLEELPYVPLWYEDQVLATRPPVAGYRLAADGSYQGLIGIHRKDGDG